MITNSWPGIKLLQICNLSFFVSLTVFSQKDAKLKYMLIDSKLLSWLITEGLNLRL